MITVMRPSLKMCAATDFKEKPDQAAIHAAFDTILDEYWTGEDPSRPGSLPVAP